MVLAAYKHIFIISAILKEVFCKDTNLLRKGKARACESLGFVVNLKSASNLNGNLNCSKELEHYAS